MKSMDFEFPEGATPLADCSDLLIPWVQNMRDLNRVESENISQAQRKYLRPASQDVSVWFHPKELQTIHRAMFGSVWSWAGKQRKQVTSIGVRPALIPLQIAELCKEVSSWATEGTELTFLEKSARIHHSLVFIHPFENGNGRFSRLVADRALLTWKCPHPIWPDNLHADGNSRKHYIQALKAADKGDYEPLVLFMKSLGASDPSLTTLILDGFYKSYLEGTKGLSKIKALLRNGADPNSTLANGHRLLQSVIRSKMKSQKKLEILELLFEKGSEIDCADKSGMTPLQVAVELQDINMARFLRSKGAREIAFPGLGYAKNK